jgi:hypothetical protein
MSCRFRVLTSVLTYAIAAIARDCDEGGLLGDTLQVSTEDSPCDAVRAMLPLIAVWHVSGESCSSNVTRFACG